MPIALRPLAPPAMPGEAVEPPALAPELYDRRCTALYERAGADHVVVYGDREHFANIAFLSGFDPRFEEALLVLGPGGRRVLVTGNECESYAALSPLPGVSVALAQTLSLMAQDRTVRPKLGAVLAEAGIRRGDTVALAGWKYLEREEIDDDGPAFFVPGFIVDVLRRLTGDAGNVVEATPLLMHPETGLRARIDADQIAAFEWAAMRASQAVWRILAGVRPGESEFEAAGRMGYQGEAFNVHTMFASASPGTPVIGLRSPAARRLAKGDGVTTAVGFWGALASRAGLLTDGDADFLAPASTYFEALATWYETANLDVEGGAVFGAVTEALARGGLRAALNPGHLTGLDEWVHSPIRPGSTDRLRSGMPFQVDVIPVPMPDGRALNCEDAAALADEALRADLARRHPAVHARIEARRTFMRNELGVALNDCILPLSSTPLCLPPFWLAADRLLTRQ